MQRIRYFHKDAPYKSTFTFKFTLHILARNDAFWAVFGPDRTRYAWLSAHNDLPQEIQKKVPKACEGSPVGLGTNNL